MIIYNFLYNFENKTIIYNLRKDWEALVLPGFYGEAVAADCGCTTVQKTHGFALLGQVPTSAGARLAEVRAFGGRAILLIRNPYEAIISYRNFLYGGHTGFAPYARFHGPGKLQPIVIDKLK